jgi:hypothetical protein
MKISSKLGPEARERKRDEQKYDAARVLYVFVCPVICCIAQALPPPAVHSYLQGSLTPAAAVHTAELKSTCRQASLHATGTATKLSR